MVLTRTENRFTWVDEGVSRYMDRHPRAEDRVTPLGAPLDEVLLCHEALQAGSLRPLAELPSLPTSTLDCMDSAEGARAALLVNYYARVVGTGVIASLQELMAGLGGLDANHLEALAPAFESFVLQIGNLANRLHTAREACGQALSRLRSAHNKFAEVSTAARHKEAARHHTIRTQGGRPGSGDETLREVPGRIGRAFQAAVGKTVVAQREVDLVVARLYDHARWPALAAPAASALEALRSLRSEAEAGAGRCSAYPRIRRAASDLRSAATYASGQVETALRSLRIPERERSALESVLTTGR